MIPFRHLSVILALFPSAALPACVSYSTHTVPIRVLDADTGEGVAGCTVGVWHPGLMPMLNWPDPVETVTDAAGKATLRVADLHPAWGWKHPDYGSSDGVIWGKADAWPVPEEWADPAHPGCAVLRLMKKE